MILNIEELSKIVNNLKNQGKKIVTTAGCYDLLHPGHIHTLNQAKKEGDILIVLLNSDSSVKMLKGDRRPVIPEKDRAEILTALKAVDYVCIFNERDPSMQLTKIKPHVHVKGGSSDRDVAKKEMKLLKKLGVEYKSFDMNKDYSTTSIIKRINSSAWKVNTPLP